MVTTQQLALARPGSTFDKGCIRLKDGTLLVPSKIISFDRVDAPDRDLLMSVRHRRVVS